MTKYQLADQVNGLFGDIYDTQLEADSALDDLVAELLPTAMEEVRMEEDAAAEAAYREPAIFAEEDLSARAEARIRAFHSIEEVDE